MYLYECVYMYVCNLVCLCGGRVVFVVCLSVCMRVCFCGINTSGNCYSTMVIVVTIALLSDAIS